MIHVALSSSSLIINSRVMEGVLPNVPCSHTAHIASSAPSFPVGLQTARVMGKFSMQGGEDHKWECTVCTFSGDTIKDISQASVRIS